MANGECRMAFARDAPGTRMNPGRSNRDPFSTHTRGAMPVAHDSRRSVLLIAFAFFFIHCSQAQDVLEPAFPALHFTRPVDLQAPRDDTNRIFVVEQAGVIRVFENRDDVAAADVFLDIRDRVRDNGNEEGLLGLAFHPSFARNGYFFVNYTASSPRRTVVSRFALDPTEPSRADPSSEVVFLEFNQPFGNHNGGQIAFGPDGYLYIATGDGGSAGDPLRNGQNPNTLLGAILRIDVDREAGGRRYAIPPDNPFAGRAGTHREEIYAYGLRNPWRFSFDPETGTLWAGDVGQNAFEEIDIIVRGGNYGWNVREATHCYEPRTNCPDDGLVPPVVEYGRNKGISVTGGYVYRGSRIPEYFGRYFYADYGSGRIWSLSYDGTSVIENTELANTNLNISSFGVDASNELYMCAFDGLIYRFKRPE